MALPANEASAYIDYEDFLGPEFNEYTFANKLVLSTNDPNDTLIDLATPLSKVLFDIQEIDSHIDVVTSTAAIPLLTHTQSQTAASRQTVAELEPQIQALNESYRQLEREVIRKHVEADEVRRAALRLWESQRLGRSVGRYLQLVRQLELQYGEVTGGVAAATVSSPASSSSPSSTLVRCAYTLLSLQNVLQHKASGEEGHGLDRVTAVARLQSAVVAPVESYVREAAERIVKEFSLSSVGAGASLTFAQAEEAKLRTSSALVALYLLSPGVADSGGTQTADKAKNKDNAWAPTVMLQALERYLKAALQSSFASLARSLAALPSLERTLAEVSARCRNIVALEQLLQSTRVPEVEGISSTTAASNSTVSPSTSTSHSTLLSPLLSRLETSSLPSFFWRSLASNLGPRVQEIMNRGGAAARSLRANKNNIGEALHECVLRGVQPVGGGDNGNARGHATTAKAKASWEREVAVMVGSVTGNIR